MKTENIMTHFDKVCVANPDAISIETFDKKISYFELRNQVALYSAYLKMYYEATNCKELQPGCLIGIYVERSPELIIAILSILKLNCTYVPINTNFPESRVGTILEDAKIDFILTQSSLHPKINRILRKASINALLADMNDDFSLNTVEPGHQNSLNSEHILNDAYLLYTSGSTGKPKGILIGQKGLLNVSKFQADTFSLSYSSKVLGFAHCSFDASAWEIFGSLLSGATYCLPTEDALIPGETLENTINYFAVTHVTLPPSVLKILSPINMPTLQCVISAGEALTVAVMKKWNQGKWKFFNAYGPTEATICAMLEDCSKDAEQVYLGRPISNVEIYLLNESKEIVNTGEVGEIVICGLGLASGYFADPKLTAEKFLHLSQFNKIGYFSGDLARKLQDNKLEYIGRKDNLVKLRGFRIELGEIESTASKMEGISQVAAVVKQHNDQDVLVLYYSILDQAKEFDHSSIKTHLSKTLASYMLPQRYISLDVFPMTENIKIDKAKLPDLNDYVTSDISENDETSAKLITLIQRILAVPVVQLQDDFFDIGGHSMLITQVIIAIKQCYSVTLTMQEFMNNTKILQLAKVVRDKMEQVSVPITNSTLPIIEKASSNSEKSFPLTDIQQAYFLGRSGEFELSTVSTNIYREYTFNEFNIEQLQTAINSLINRHGMLRCIIMSSESQRVLDKIDTFIIKKYDLSAASDIEVKSHFTKIRNEMSLVPLPTDKAPIFDIRATVLGHTVHIHFVIDALIIDGWSYFIFFDELEQLYKGNNNMPLLNLSFQEYVIAEEKIKSTQQYSIDKQYWMDRLSNFPVGPNLPLLQQPRDVVEPESATLRKVIEPSTWSLIKAIGSAYQLTPTLILLTIFSDVLAHATSDESFIINLTLFNRLPLHPQVNNIIGDFSSLELLEVNHKRRKEQSFIDHAATIKQQLYKDLDHRLFSGVAIQRELAKKLGNTLSGTLMPIVFTCFLKNENHNSLSDEAKLFTFDNLVFGSTQSSQVWLDFKVYEEKGALILEWDYIKNLLVPQVVEEMFEQYYGYIEKLGHEKSNWIKKNTNEFSLLPDFFKWAQPDTQSFIINKDISYYIRKAVNNHQKKIAVIDKNIEITYEKLHDHAIILARKLLKLGAKPDSLIAICMEKSYWQIISVVSILYAGAAYIPVDPDLPDVKLNQLLIDTKVTALLTLATNMRKLTHLNEYDNKLKDRTIILDDPSTFMSEDYKDVIISNDPSDLAYVIYTSGSTGTPKGVMIEHRSAVNTIIDMNERFNVTSEDKILALSNLNFDLSVYDIFGLLFVGGCIVIPDSNMLKEPSHWLDLLLKHQITIWNTVPMFMQILIEYMKGEQLQADLSNLRLCLMSGDWIPILLPEQIRSLHKTPKSLQLISLGGATECAIWSILYTINDILSSWISIPYGFAMKNQGVYVLDKNYNPCPCWVEGDIYISGLGLARGYWNDPIKTANQFIEHPGNHIRLYRTGDLGRYYPDGNIEFRGRNDGQIKLGGHRIELAEIEHHLIEHPCVHTAIVEMVQGVHGQDRLVAFIQSYESLSKIHSKIDGGIATHLDKQQFRLEHHNIQNLSFIKIIDLPSISKEAELFLKFCERKSHRQFEKTCIPKPILLRLFSSICEEMPDKFNKKQDLSITLSTALNELRGVIANDMFPRYGYGSAGGLYPVQVYLKIINSDTNLETGYFYFDPLKYTLNLISPLTEYEKGNQNSAIEFFLVGYLPAIFPIYGQLSQHLLWLEAGYIVQVLKSTGLRVNLIEGSNFPNHNLDEIKKSLTLSNAHLPLISLDIQSLTNIESKNDCLTFNNTFKEEIFIYLYVKSGTISELDPGLYKIDRKDGGMEFITAELYIDNDSFFGDNLAIFRSASFAVFIFSDAESGSLAVNRSRLMAGEVAQFLMEHTFQTKIGFCPIGEMLPLEEKRLCAMVGKASLIHILFGGSVTEKAISQKYSSTIEEQYILEPKHIEEFLSHRLPEYMVVKEYNFLEKIPLTENGKVDRGFLKKSCLQSKRLASFKNNKSRVPNKLEKELTGIWKEILQVDLVELDDNFVRLGGNSLLFVRLLNNINNKYSIKIKLSQLINNPTIEKNAILIKSVKSQNKAFEILI